jgi:hypothetical protein
MSQRRAEEIAAQTEKRRENPTIVEDTIRSLKREDFEILASTEECTIGIQNTT